MFRKRQPFHSLGSGAIYEVVRIRDEQGQIVEQMENVARSLPPVETTSLEALLMAGVSLEQVNTKILKPDMTNLTLALNAPEEQPNNFEQPNKEGN